MGHGRSVDNHPWVAKYLSMRTLLSKTAATALAALMALPVFAEPDLRLVVSRLDDSVEIYAALRADALPGILQADPYGLAAADGRVYFGDFRKSGTFDFGDQMISQVGFTVDGADTKLEAMSVMVHPDTNILPFESPIDGVIAMSVCTVPDPVVPPQIDELRLYSGVVAYPVDGHSALNLSLPHAEPIKVELVTFVDGDEDSRATLLLQPGEDMVFEPNQPDTWAGRLGLTRLWSD